MGEGRDGVIVRHVDDDPSALKGEMSGIWKRNRIQRDQRIRVVVNRKTLFPRLTVAITMNFIQKVFRRLPIAIAGALPKHSDILIAEASKVSHPIELHNSSTGIGHHSADILAIWQQEEAGGNWVLIPPLVVWQFFAHDFDLPVGRQFLSFVNAIQIFDQCR